jgi:hypothetical protein
MVAAAAAAVAVLHWSLSDALPRSGLPSHPALSASKKRSVVHTPGQTVAAEPRGVVAIAVASEGEWSRPTTATIAILLESG